MTGLVLAGALLAAVPALAMQRAPLWAWAVLAAFATIASLATGSALLTAVLLLGALTLAALTIPEIRRAALVGPLFRFLRSRLPRISDTERQALVAGTTGFDAELFSGQPDWSKLAAIPGIRLTPEEKAFLDGPTEQFCRLIDDWRMRHRDRAISPEIWDYAKRAGFLGMLISKEHGGLGFSAQAQSLILAKIASRSPDAVTVVMVPNSLGPGELIERYGTAEQKDYYLPRLARGDEVPCFALTGPTSGSDAATMRDVGIVVRGLHEGRDVVGIRVSWDKRYITLAPEATLVGLAFRLVDPDNLLGQGPEPGITVAIVPADHPGVNIGRRHLPCGAAFPNGPTSGTDVFIPADWIIGGPAMAGHGWRMLMECLSAGRSISLPSSAAAGCMTMARVTTAYARVRRQFGLPIGRMEGVEEPLVRIVENAYVTEATRAVTAAMVSQGERPAVISALVKYLTTERLRQSVADAMDIHGGRGICDGPSNYLQSAYQMVPVAITVEGANILTRTLIAFAQGALRSHPYLQAEIAAAEDADASRGLAAFETAFLAHTSFLVANAFGALVHNLSGGRFAPAPAAAGSEASWYRQLSRASRNFALVADVAVATLGGSLKIRQKTTGRLADALGELYLAAAVLKRYADDGRPAEDRDLVDLALANGLARFYAALGQAIDNFPIGPLRPILAALVFPLGRRQRPASDRLAHAVALKVLVPGAFRDRLTRGIFVATEPTDPTGRLEAAFAAAVAAEDAERKLDRAVREGRVRRVHGVDWFKDAVTAGVLTDAEAAQLRELERLTAAAIAVDHFEPADITIRRDAQSGAAAAARAAAE
jgi:acyl-CoA dehydrogenase